MIRYDVNIGLIYAHLPIAERVAAVRRAGFRAIESFWPEANEIDALVHAIKAEEMAVALINVHEGDYRNGDRGFAAHPERQGWWRNAMQDALDLAEQVKATNLNVLTGYFDPALSQQEMIDCLVENLQWAATRAGDCGISLLLEPLNAHTHPDYICTSTQSAIDLIDAVGSPHVGMQFDCYQIAGGEGDVVSRLTDVISTVRHIQIADVPNRGEPGTGSLDYGVILEAIAGLPYSGYVGLEYVPTHDDPFDWLPREHR